MLAEKYGQKLLGVDVGFSTKRSTTAIAVLDGNEIHLARAGTGWESRAAQIPNDFRAVRFSDIALRVFEESRYGLAALAIRKRRLRGLRFHTAHIFWLVSNLLRISTIVGLRSVWWWTIFQSLPSRR
jgi:hypothetical protein